LSSKCKKFIRLSPNSKKKHSKGRNSANLDGASVPGSSGVQDTANGMAKSSGDKRTPNGISDREVDFKQVFEMFDKNNDGRISSEELGCVLRTLGHQHTAKEVDDMIKNADTNENGGVEYDEFITMMKRFQESDDTSEAEAKKREAFDVFDMDGNGYIDKHELRFVMRRLGENLSDEDIKAMFKEADLNGDGLIDFEEFSRLNMCWKETAARGPREIPRNFTRQSVTQNIVNTLLNFC